MFLLEYNMYAVYSTHMVMGIACSVVRMIPCCEEQVGFTFLAGFKLCF